jgi:hypothetical protein
VQQFSRDGISGHRVESYLTELYVLLLHLSSHVLSWDRRLDPRSAITYSILY